MLGVAMVVERSSSKYESWHLAGIGESWIPLGYEHTMRIELYR